MACQRTRIIPKDTLEDIYMDMFLADQMVREENIPRPQMDTMLLYEAVFQKYGYDTDDYLNSVRFYLKDPERFAKVFENVAKRLEGEVDALDKIIDHQNWVASACNGVLQADGRHAPLPLCEASHRSCGFSCGTRLRRPYAFQGI